MTTYAEYCKTKCEWHDSIPDSDNLHWRFNEDCGDWETRDCTAPSRDQFEQELQYQLNNATFDLQMVTEERDKLVATNAELRKDKVLLDLAADNRIVDGINGCDIDEMTLDALSGGYSAAETDSEERWRMEWRIQFRNALTAMQSAGEGK